MQRKILWVALALLAALVFAGVSLAASGIRIVVDGKALDVREARLEGGRVIVPLRPVLEAMGAEVRWDKASKTVFITTRSVAKTSQPAAQPSGLGIDPASWAERYPAEYQTYLLNNQGGVEHSKYRGSDNFDRNSAWPFQWVLYDGWGMGKQYTESRGHTLALVDQLEINPARRAAGGVCLSCKTPAAPQLKEKMGVDYYRLPYDEVYKQIPQEYNKLGVSCIDCHDPQTQELRITRWPLTEALARMQGVPASFTQSQKASLACAQCHVTYSIPKDKDKKSIGLVFPWDGARWGGITVEDIERNIKEQGLYEWTHAVTGLRLGHIRHPEFELFTNNSPHYRMGLSCASCHMPKVEVNGQTVSSHQWTSPFKQDLVACRSCHQEGAEALKQKVIAIQDRTNELYTEAGFTAAQAAKAIEMANKTLAADQQLLAQAKEAYEKAYYRVVFVGAENSMGFHNPAEAERVLKDGLAYAREAETKARQALEKAGVTPPAAFDLELNKYPYDPAQNRAAGHREQ
ncbi:MAG: ammonia-forming cytochrome c nitrite reductase subunit c552 [Clostridia bacterium]|nr:MAG: ammonia-forming cytochrome c nitrite reductase subunit c552 [Clostridia bacterium]